MDKVSPTQIIGIHTVGIPVSDQDRAVEFYVGTLGLEKRRDAPMGEGRRWIELSVPGTSTTLALEKSKEQVRTGVETGIRFTTGDADAAHAHLRQTGVEAEDVLRWPGVPAMFGFRDPDGNRLEMVEEQPR